MKEIDHTTLSTALRAANPQTRALMGSSILYESIKKCLNDQKITSPDSSVLLLPIGYHLLGIITAEEIITELKSFGLPNPQLLLSNILQMISESKTSALPEEEIDNELATELNEVELQSEIIETEDVLEHLPTIRTMAKDMHAIQHPNEPTHSSSQATILEHKSGPRWDTEQ